MDLKESNSPGFGSSPEKSNSQLGSKSKELDGDGNSDQFLRADKIDFKSWDVQLGKYLEKIWSKKREIEEEWEIDLSKLDIKNVVAHGTYGTIYKGVYDGRDVAVKVLDWGDDGHVTAGEVLALRASLEQEVAVWHKLDHPNITKVNTSEQLSYLHSKKIVHRDVKTENMLLDTYKTLKIADFGVARVEAQNPRDMTGETGTLGYMAPEVLEGKPYNRKCDVYSFGICLWEIYCCDMPYADLSFTEVSSAVVHKVPLTISVTVIDLVFSRK
ncbi:hypothetical protein L1987_63592 [Smallanthus sonchifolius]|uniref:Uncharacterized protein n=1 Tax=Smallanthus sonchifolius TaxID=185202 RepID=A0ACB9CE16_9ASTR|nr:hypothetical protein L1987_63592 [Smallanthus sonchifolius]